VFSDAPLLSVAANGLLREACNLWMEALH